MALVATASFLPLYRVATFMFLVSYVVYCGGDVLADFPFFTGALLADMSLLIAANSSLSTTNGWSLGGPLRRFKVTWPVLVCLVGLFFGSYPPDSAERSVWSRALFSWGQAILPWDCISSLNHSNSRGIHVGHSHYWRIAHRLLNSLFPGSPPYSLSQILRLSRHNLVSYVSHPRIHDAVSGSMDGLRTHSSRGWLGR